MPLKETPFQDKPMASPIDVARVSAVARLVLRSYDIGYGGMMNDPRLLPLWVMSDANRAIHLGVHVYIARRAFQFMYSSEVNRRLHGRLELVNMLPLTTRIVKQLDLTPDVELRTLRLQEVK